MDNRIFLYIALFFSGFLIIQTWSAEKRLANQPAQEVIAGAASSSATVDVNSPASLEAANDLPDAGSSVSSSTQATAAVSTQPTNTLQSADVINIKTDTFNMDIGTRGGDILSVDLPTYSVSLKDKTPFQLMQTSNPSYIAQSGLIHNKTSAGNNTGRAPTHHAVYKTTQTNYTMADSEDTLVVPLYWINEEGIQVEKRFTFHRGSFSVDVEHIIDNQSEQTWSGKQYRQIRREPAESGGNKLMAQAYVGAAYYDEKFKKRSFKKIKKEDLDLNATNTFITMLQHYFISAWIPDSAGAEENIYTRNIPGSGEPEYLIGMRSDSKEILPGQSASFASLFYAGPKLQDDLKALAPGLELTSDYGILTVIAKPIFWLLKFIHNNIVSNWGWSIILLTIIIKAMFYKLSEKGFKSMAKMRKLAPKMAKLKERFGDDKAGYQKEMMGFYKKEKINPVGGCFPILIQIPVFISLYWVLMEAVELRQAPWMLWIEDLAIKDPYFILPVIMGATMLLQHHLNPPQPDPMMQRITQILPLVFTVFFAFFPAGLVLYWVVNSALSIAQQWYITRKIDRAG